MKRNLLAWLLVLALVLSCGLTAATAEGDVTINVVTGWNEASFPNWPQAIADYEAAHPGVKVNIEYTPAGEDATTKIKAGLIAGNAPDIFQTWKVYFNDFVDAGYLTDLTEAYQQYGFVDGALAGGCRNWCAPLMDAASADAHSYGVSDFICPSVFYYNTDIFTELPVFAFRVLVRRAHARRRSGRGLSRLRARIWLVWGIGLLGGD